LPLPPALVGRRSDPASCAFLGTPEQVRFLRHRPVLSNRRLVQEFGYRPRLGTREAFERFVEARHQGRARSA
jgi:hypothetical protein